MLLKTLPRNSWDAVLTQVILWSFRRFCVAKLSSDTDLWDDSIDLVTTYAPASFHPLLAEWLSPEKMGHLHRLTELDADLRALVVKLEGEEQEATAEYLDVGLSPEIETWLGAAYAPYSLFPTPDEPDETVDATKLNAIVLLLRIQRSIQHRKTRSSRMAKPTQTAPIRTQIRKTRRRDKNGTLPLSEPRKPQRDSETGQREERKGDEVRSEAQEAAREAAHTEGSEEHHEPPVHADALQGSDAEKQVPNKDNQTEEAQA
jgi:hypothetical protein